MGTMGLQVKYRHAHSAHWEHIQMTLDYSLASPVQMVPTLSTRAQIVLLRVFPAQWVHMGQLLHASSVQQEHSTQTLEKANPQTVNSAPRALILIMMDGLLVGMHR